MSVDWNILCDKCKQWHHLGQDSGSCCSFGYGSQDLTGRESAGEFISCHIAHNFQKNEFLRLVHTDNIPIDYVEQKELGE